LKKKNLDTSGRSIQPFNGIGQDQGSGPLFDDTNTQAFAWKMSRGVQPWQDEHA
jgi:hypothetical protein